MIHIAGLGPGNPGDVTLKVRRLMAQCRVLLRTKEHPTVEALTGWGIDYTSFDDFYEKYDEFEQVYAAIAREVVRLAKEGGDLLYLVPGNPFIAEKSVQELLQLLKTEDLSWEIHGAVSFIDSLLATVQRDPIEGLQIIDGQGLAQQGINPRADVIVTQVYNPRLASDVKLALGFYMEDEAELLFIKGAGLAEEEVKRIPLWQLDRQRVDHLTSLYIPRESFRPDFFSFKQTVDALRAPGGCPWDREQTHDSLRRYLIEEAYEAVDAILAEDVDNLREELGDVLLQVVLHSRIAEEAGDFTIQDVIASVNDKMISRHPHVFGQLNLDTADQVLDNWEKIKKEEKGPVSLADKLKSLPRSLPAMMRVAEIQKKAAAYGIKRPEPAEITAKIHRLLDGDLDSEAAMADLLYETARLAAAKGFEAESITSRRVDQILAELVEKEG